MGNFLKINDRKVMDIPIKDSEESLIDLLPYSEFVVDVTQKYIWEHKEPISLVRKQVAEKLLLANRYLSDGIKFKIIEGYRSLNIQRKIFEWQKKEFKKQNPEWNEEKLQIETGKFVAFPESIPPHSTGGAIDITLVDKNSNELDMGTLINEGYGGNCFTNAENISEVAKRNRKTLISVLEKVGFVNYPTEWWHWSYGDRYWAASTKNKFAIYGSVLEIKL